MGQSSGCRGVGGCWEESSGGSPGTAVGLADPARPHLHPPMGILAIYLCCLIMSYDFYTPFYTEPESNLPHRHYLNLHKLCIEDVLWVDEVNSLREAINYFKNCKVVGVDCEWKPNYENGSRPSKILQVSIMQIASEKKVYILDLIKLYADVPSILDECLGCLFHSSSILKLGYNFQCDVRQLALSYRDLNCFKHCEMLLDIQNVFREPKGGLSGLAEKILGISLNKTRRNSNWEQRPLSHYQLEYAALDAAVLLHIFWHVGRHSQPVGTSDGNAKIEWKSQNISHMDSSKLPRKDVKIGNKPDTLMN